MISRRRAGMIDGKVWWDVADFPWLQFRLRFLFDRRPPRVRRFSCSGWGTALAGRQQGFPGFCARLHFNSDKARAVVSCLIRKIAPAYTSILK
jgi:hypothetical protein